MYKTKSGSEIDKFIFILIWSVSHSTRIALRYPSWPLTGLIIPWEALRGPKLPKLVFQGCPGLDRGQSVHLGANLELLRPLQVIPNTTLSISKPYFVLQISQPANIEHKWFCIQNLHMDLSFQRKKRFRNLFIGFGDIQQTNILTFFLNTLYIITFCNIL